MTAYLKNAGMKFQISLHPVGGDSTTVRLFISICNLYLTSLSISVSCTIIAVKKWLGYLIDFWNNCWLTTAAEWYFLFWWHTTGSQLSLLIRPLSAFSRQHIHVCQRIVAAPTSLYCLPLSAPVWSYSSPLSFNLLLSADGLSPLPPLLKQADACPSSSSPL